MRLIRKIFIIVEACFMTALGVLTSQQDLSIKTNEQEKILKVKV